MKFHFDHFNINVADRERAIDFYRRALGLEIVSTKTGADGSYDLTYMSAPGENFRLELTFLHDHTAPYELGENESHLAFRTDDYEAAHKLHSEMGIICFENPTVGIYFIEDPDGYWIEIIPPRLGTKPMQADFSKNPSE